jgi:hypothetical protein
LAAAERADFVHIAAALESPDTADKDGLLARLGELASHADDHDTEPAARCVSIDGEI